MDEKDQAYEERINAMLAQHLSELREHFDAVQILASREVDDRTSMAFWGSGNTFAREGMAQRWLDMQVEDGGE